MEPTATVSLVIRLLARGMPWLLSRLFSKQKLDELLDIQPMPTGEGIDISYPNRSVACWLRVINLTPFVLQVDRLEITIVADGLSVRAQKVLPETILSLNRAQLYCQGTFDADPAAVALAVKSKRIRLEVRGYAKCSAKDFLFSRHYDDLKGFRIIG